MHAASSASTSGSYAHCEVFDIDRPVQVCDLATDQFGHPIYGKVLCCLQCLDHSQLGDCATCPFLTANEDGCF